MGENPMADRFDIGDGWIEVSREVQSATYQMSGETGKGINECIAEMLSGETDPAEYGLVAEDDGEDGGEDEESDE